MSKRIWTRAEIHLIFLLKTQRDVLEEAVHDPRRNRSAEQRRVGRGWELKQYNKFHSLSLSDLPAVSPAHSSTADPKPWTWSPAAARWSTAAAEAWQTSAGLSLRWRHNSLPDYDNNTKIKTKTSKQKKKQPVIPPQSIYLCYSSALPAAAAAAAVPQWSSPLHLVWKLL